MWRKKNVMKDFHFRKEENKELLKLVKCIRREDSAYPESFLLYPRMPLEFYVMGSLPDPGKKTVAIVGSRTCSEYGKNEALRFGRSLAENGVQIVSGMAYGIDAWAQKGALDGGGRTFAILGSGVDICYPGSNYPLYRRILREGGGLLSEFEMGAPPSAWHFPIRNRLISAFADIVLVVEARLRSGSLITVDYAIEQGKTIYAVPGRNGDVQSQGCNRLIAEGAGIAWDPEILLEELGVIKEARLPFSASSGSMSDGRAGPLHPSRHVSSESCASKSPALSHNPHALPDPSAAILPKASPPASARHSSHSAFKEPPPKTLPEKWAHADDFQKVFRHLGSDPVSLDQLQKASGLDMQTLSSVLMQLCISGFAEEPFPGYYLKVR